jgi:hypothetical protein
VTYSGAHSASALELARRDVEAACRLLETPTPAQMDASTAALSAAVERLRNIPRFQPPDGGAEARLLQHSVNKARRLLEQANEYHACWARVLFGMSGSYTHYGALEPLRLGPRFCQEG